MSPIRPENRARYPSEWAAISRNVRLAALWHCQCDGRCGGKSCGVPLSRRGAGRICGAFDGNPHPITGSKVILTVAHLDHTPENCDPANLMAMCQACHLSYDADHHAETARATRAAALAEQMEPMF